MLDLHYVFSIMLDNFILYVLGFFGSYDDEILDYYSKN